MITVYRFQIKSEINTVESIKVQTK